MDKPILQYDKNLLKRLEDNKINTNLTQRWEEGIDHHPKSEEIARDMAGVDWMFCGDYFCWKFGSV